MALGSTIYNFEIALADSSRHIYEDLALRIARHPSETLEYSLCRVMAYCVEFVEGLEFSKGLDDPVMPALWRKDLTGQLTHWIEIGAPSAEKLHKASKAVEHVVVYAHKNAPLILDQLTAQKIHRGAEIKFYAVDPKLLSELALLTERRNQWAFSVNEEVLYIDAGGQSFSTALNFQHL